MEKGGILQYKWSFNKKEKGGRIWLYYLSHTTRGDKARVQVMGITVWIGYLQRLSYLFFWGIANMYINKIKVVGFNQP